MEPKPAADSTSSAAQEKNWTHHPLLTLVIGFMLTGIVGASITFYYNKLANETTHLQEQIASRQTNITKLTDDLIFYGSASIQFANKLLIDVPNDHLLQSIKRYDDASANALAAMLRMEFVMYGERKNDDPDAKQARKALDAIVKEVGDRIVPLYYSIESCLAHMYVLRLQNKYLQITPECNQDTDPAHRGIPANFFTRVDMYEGCAQRIADIFLYAGTDPDQRAWGNAKQIGELKRQLDESDFECPPLDKPSSASGH